MSYWGTGYWATGYWADDYWADGASAPAEGGTSTLYVERVVEVVKFTLQKKTGGSDTFYVAQDYWGEGTLYTDSPEVYPVLAEPVPSPRSIQNNLGVRHDVSIAIFGKSPYVPRAMAKLVIPHAIATTVFAPLVFRAAARVQMLAAGYLDPSRGSEQRTIDGRLASAARVQPVEDLK